MHPEAQEALEHAHQKGKSTRGCWAKREAVRPEEQQSGQLRAGPGMQAGMQDAEKRVEIGKKSSNLLSSSTVKNDGASPKRTMSELRGEVW